MNDADAARLRELEHFINRAKDQITSPADDAIIAALDTIVAILRAAGRSHQPETERER